jgi:GAF domain-containing protein
MDVPRSSSERLDQVLITEQLRARPARHVGDDVLDRAILRLTWLMAEFPNEVLRRVAEVALELCDADSVGINLLESEEGRDVFRWRALAGRLGAATGPAMGATMRPDASPCGMVLDRRTDLLFAHPERYFAFAGPLDPPIVETLVAPLFDRGEATGTIWIIAHDERRKFDAEDARIVHELCSFASSAYSLLIDLGYAQDRRLLRRAGPDRSSH